MIKRIAAVILCLAMILGANMIIDTIMNFTTTVKGDTLFVNETGEDEAYTVIQDAIDNASIGDTVFVYNGTYYENLMINKTINLTGIDWNITIIHGNRSGDVINVTSDWVNISGFIITGWGLGPDDVAIELNDTQNCTIADCRFYFILPPSPPILNFTPPNITVVPINQTNFTVGYYGELWVINTDPILNLTIIEEHTFNGSTYIIIMENPQYFDENDLVIFGNASVQLERNKTIIKINDTIGDPFIVHNIREILTSIPHAPTNLTATSGDSYINLSWDIQFPDHYFPIKNYRIYRSYKSGEETFLAEIGNFTFYNDTNVINGITYFYRVSAKNAVDEGRLSNEINATPMISTSSKQTPSPYENKPGWLWILFVVMVAVYALGAIVNYIFEKRKGI